MKDLDFSMKREFCAPTMAEAVRQFDEAMGLGLGLLWRRATAGESKRTVIKVHVPASSRDAALPAIERLRVRASANGWQVLLGRNATDGQFHLNVSESELPVERRQPPVPAVPSWFPAWATRLASKWVDVPVGEPSPDPGFVSSKLQAAYAKARRMQPPLDGQVLRGSTVTFLHGSWRTALQQHADANRAKGLVIELNHLDGFSSLPPELMEELMEDKVLMELHYGEAAPANGITERPDTTLPPDWPDAPGDAPAPAKRRAALLTMRYADRSVEEPIVPDAQGELTLARCGLQAEQIVRLLRELGAERRLSSQPPNALRLRLEETGAVVTAAGHPDYYRLQDGRPVLISTKLPFPVGLMANGVQIHVRPLPARS